MNKYIISTVLCIIIIVLGLIYKQTRISITGFNISKRQLEYVLITTNDQIYKVTDSNLVLEISKEISRMDKYMEIQPNNFPPSKNQPSNFLKIRVKTKNKGLIGGSFWNNDNNVVLDSNGYYWITNKRLFDLLEISLKNATKL